MHVVLKKKYSQNFLTDKNILNKIANLVDINLSNILEIGPGSGNLTELILKTYPENLLIIEIDKDLIKSLKSKFFQNKNLIILNEDILKNKLILNFKFDLIISNLPYNISSKILVKIMSSNFRPKKMILMFQKEFALRLLSKNLNSLNSLVNSFYNIKLKFNVSRNSFIPIPKVDSSVLEFIELENYLLEENEIESFIIFKRDIFNKKRKTLRSVLKSKYSLINNLDIDLNSRAEDLNLKKFIEIFRLIT